MEEEIRSIEKNQTLEMVDLPQHRVPISLIWIFKTNLKLDGTVAKHKALLVAKGFMQKECLDYFAPMVKLKNNKANNSFGQFEVLENVAT